MRYIFFLLMLLSTGLVSAQSINCLSASETAKDFFNNNYNYAFADQLDSNLSPDLMHLIQKEVLCKKQGQSCAIDWDPWIGGQDGEIISQPYFKVNTVSDFSANVTVVLKINNGLRPDGSEFVFKNKTIIILKRKSKNSCWEVYDHILKNNQSIRKILKDNYIQK